jgi:hypothetical protein
MGKHSVFAGGVLLLVGVIAFQSMRAADAVPGASPAQTISPMQMMQTAHDLPVERVDKLF